MIGWGGLSVSADDCEQLRKELPSLSGKKLIQAYENIYYCSLDSDDFDYQLRCVNDYIAEAHRQGLKDVEVDALAERATLFYNNDKNDSIFTVVRKDLEFVEACGEWQVYYEMWANIPETYLFMNQNNIGLRETQAMYEDAKSRENAYGMGLAYSIMGTAYANLHNYDKSIDAYNQSLEIFTRMRPTPSLLPTIYTYYGNALNDMRNYEGLEKLTVEWKVSLDNFIKEHGLEGNPTADMYKSYYYLACAQAALGLGKLIVADEMLNEAHAYIYVENSPRGGAWLFYTAQLKLLQGKLYEALHLNDKRMRQIAEGSDKTVLIRTLKQRAEILKGLGRFAEAADTYNEMYVINDSVNSMDVKNQLAEMNTIYQLDEAEMENERLQMEKERDQFRFVIIVVSVAILSLGILLFFRIRANRKLKQAHNELKVAYSDLQAANQLIEETTAAKERIESELRIARDIQMSMVPNVFPQYPGLDIYASMNPAKEVGGDLYSTLQLDNQLYFCVGDVSGKGVPASLFMAQATRLFRTLAKQGLHPAEIGTKLNEELAEENDQGMFVTMFLGRIDLSTGHMDFCNAGHNPPVLGGAFLEMEPNAPAGLWPGLEYVGEEIADIREKPLFIYTDGLNEAENKQQVQFGDDHLLEVLANNNFESAQHTVELFESEVEKHRDGADPNDDLTMMCIMLKNNN